MPETCWFCKKNSADNTKPYIIPIHLTLKNSSFSSPNTITYRKSTVDIPRCRQCKIIHSITKIAKIVGYCSIVLVFIVGGQPNSPDIIQTAGIPFLITMILLLIGGSIIQRYYLKTNHELAVRLKDGWKLGKEPNPFR